MAKSTSQMIAALQKLYDKRSALDKQIIAAEQNLVSVVESAKTAVKVAPAKAGKAVKAVKKVVATAKKPTGKPRGRRPANPAQ